MKSEGKTKILVIAIIIILVLAIIWIVTRNKGDNNGTQTDSSQSKTSSQTDDKNEDYSGPLTETKNDGVITNISPKLSKERKLDDYKISNISLTKETNGITRFSADVTNKTDRNLGSTKIEVVLLDKKGNELGRIPGVIIATKPGETIEVRTEINQDFVSAYDFKIVKK